jgi:hypothetical protein
MEGPCAVARGKDISSLTQPIAAATWPAAYSTVASSTGTGTVPVPMPMRHWGNIIGIQ